MESRVALRMREEPGFGAKVKRWMACLMVCGGYKRGFLEERGAGPELGIFKWKLLDGVRLENQPSNNSCIRMN